MGHGIVPEFPRWVLDVLHGAAMVVPCVDPATETPPSPDVRARIAAYEGWIATLDATLADYHRRRLVYTRFFTVLLVAGVGAFVFGVYPGIYGVLCSTVISGGGYWMYRTRLWEIETEIAENRAEIAALRAARTTHRIA